MTKRNHSNIAPPLPLSAAVNSSATTLQVTSTTGYPAPPFILAIERGTSLEEVCLCTAKTVSTFTVVRGYDATVVSAHGIGAMVEHTVAGVDYRESSNTPMTTVERDALTGAERWDGMFITNTDTGTIERWNGAAWIAMVRSTDLDSSVAGVNSAKADKTTTVSAGAGLTGGGDLSANRTLAADFHTSGTSTKIARSDDVRFTDARNPLSHIHPTNQVTDLDAILATKAPLASPTFTGLVTIGTTDSQITHDRAMTVATHTRSTVETYDGSGRLATVLEKVGSTTVRTTTMTYNATTGLLTSVQQVGGGKTVTTALNYTGSNLTSTTRSVV